MKNLLFLLLSSAFLLNSCGELVTDSHPDFVGTWISTDFTNTYILVIDDENNARFDRLDLNGDTIQTNLGTARINSSDKLIIGNIKLNITEYPSYNDQTMQWTCQLENWPFLKQ